MKIACQSCQAKYTIADEKVVGKVVKIRCKKCGSTIVVNGQDGGQAAPEEPTEVRNTGGDAGGAGDAEAWTVNVADNDQRTMTTHQIVAEFATGVVTDETYCWRDGMGDWLPLREVEELASACGLTAASAFARQSAPAPAQPQAAATAGSPIAGLFGGAAPEPAAAARRGGRAGGADLFGAAAEAGGENDVMTSAPTNGSSSRAPVDDGKMTGQRNENSVLFSLNALTANEPKKGGSDNKLVGAAEGDGSGLIDIRALSSGMSSSGPKKPNHADDIMNLGGGGAFSAALAAPVLTAPPLDSGDPGSPGAAASNQKMMMMFGGLALLLVIGMVGMYFALKPAPLPPVATNDGTNTPTGAGSAAAPAAPTGAAPTASAATAAAAPTTDPAAVAAKDPMAAPSPGKRSGGSAASAPQHEAVASNTPPPPPAAPAAPAGAPKSFDQQMREAANASAPPANAAPANNGSTAAFDRGAASAALGAIADSVSSCKKPGGPTGDGHVSITFSPSGGVVSAIVDQPPFAGTAVGGCVAGKFRGAHVPAFSGGNLTIGKRFSIN